MSLSSSSSPSLNQFVVLKDSNVEILKKNYLKHILASGKSLTFRKGGKGKGYDGLRPIKVKLFSLMQQSSSAAATNLVVNTNIALNAATFPELANFGVVYDQLRMLGVKLHYFPYILTPGAAPVNSIFACSLQFDPNIGNPASVTSELEESYNSGLLFLAPGVNGATNQSSLMHLPYRTLKASAPKLAPITGDDCPGSNWVVIDASTAPTMVVVSAFAGALGAGGVVSMSYTVELDIELRIRT
jgi:hypothetical protein